MTPDQLLSTMHRQREDLAAMRGALEELAKILPPAMSDGWLKALRARIATAKEAAKTLPQDQAVAVLGVSQAQSRLSTVLEQAAKRGPVAG